MAEALFTSVWKSEPGERYVWYGANWMGFQAKLQELGSRGYQLRSATTAPGATTAEWSGVWCKGSRAEAWRNDLTWQALVASDAQLRGQGYYPRALKSYAGAAGPLWGAVWSTGEPAVLSPPVAWSAFWRSWLEHHAQARHLVDIDTCMVGGNRCWTGLWAARSGDQFIWYGASWAGIVDKNAELARQGLALDILQSYDDNGVRRWVGVWTQAKEPALFVSDQNEGQFWQEWQKQAQQGRQLAFLQCWRGTGYAPAPRLAYRLRLAIRVVSTPDLPVADMIDRMREVFERAGCQVEVASSQTLDLGGKLDIDTGACSASTLTADQAAIFSRREGMEPRDIAVYFVRTTVPPFNGCAAHPPDRPGVIVSSYASAWTLAHEVGHVLGLDHVADARRLMTSLGTANIIDPPPNLTDNEIGTMTSSPVILAVA